MTHASTVTNAGTITEELRASIVKRIGYDTRFGKSSHAIVLFFDFGIIAANTAAHALFADDTLLASSLFDYILEKNEFSDVQKNAFKKQLDLTRDEGFNRIECQCRKKDGSAFHCEFIIYLAKVWNGAPVFAAVLTDVSERVTQEYERQQTRLQLEAIIENALDAKVIIDHENNIEHWNPAAEQMFGYSHAEVLHNPLSEFIIPPEFREAHRKGLERFFETGEGPVLNNRIEIYALHQKGHTFPVELTITPLKVGERYSFSASIRDITQQKEAAETLKRAKDEAEEASKAKSQFLGTTSHELRTPLNSIINFAQFLVNGVAETEEERVECASSILQSGKRLLNLVNDILDFTKLDSGKMELEQTEFDITELVGEMDATMRGLFVKKSHIAFNVDFTNSLPKVYADKQKVEQILYNLVSNAAKFTDDGHVRIYAEHQEQFLCIKVEDTGKGIATEDQEKIFDLFVQLGRETNEQQGTGLGLAIVKQLVELQGGQVGLISAVNTGTTFHFTLPVST